MGNKKLKVLIVVGTRPEIIRLSSVIKKIDKYCNLYFAHTGQNFDYELNEIFFKDLNLRPPDVYLDCGSNSSSSSETIGKVIFDVDKIIAKVKPDCMLVLGDTNSCMAVISAKRRKVPTFHMEAGNRCFDDRVPEEINRRIVDHTADINLTYSSISREYLLREGLLPDRVIKTGSPMMEVLKAQSELINRSNILQKLKVNQYGYFVVSLHREENIDSQIIFPKMIEVLSAVAEKYKRPIIFSAHPRTQKKLSREKAQLPELIKIIKPLGFNDYQYLQINSSAVLSDSGTINEESSILNFPALNLREAFERPEAMEEAAVMMVGMDKDSVLRGLSILESQSRGIDRSLKIVHDYDLENVSDKVIRIIHSYTDYVNRVVWKKY